MNNVVKRMTLLVQYSLWKLNTYAQDNTMHYTNTKEHLRVLLYTFKRVPLREGNGGGGLKILKRESRRHKFNGPMLIGFADRYPS